jgi:AcrR family transcriptional regulator
MSVRSYEQALILAGMPRTRSAGLKAHLVQAAAELLDREAPATLTTRQIARHAAVSDGVLYNHFADRDELVVTALGSRYAQLVDAFEARLAAATPVGEGTPTALETLRAWLRAYALALRDLEAGALHLAAGILAERRLLEAFWIEMHRAPLGLDRLRRPLVERLERARATRVLPGDLDVDAAATLVFGATLMSAITIRVNAHVDRERVDRDLAVAVDLITAAAG